MINDVVMIDAHHKSFFFRTAGNNDRVSQQKNREHEDEYEKELLDCVILVGLVEFNVKLLRKSTLVVTR